jgi:hypothetical protein
MERQRRLFARDVLAWFIIDELSLYRWPGRPRSWPRRCVTSQTWQPCRT